jgi:REP-associated tyrosine transposase
MGLAPAPAWLNADGLLAHFGPRGDRARQAYAAFVRDGSGAASPWDSLRHQIYLGNDDFIAGVVRDHAPADHAEIPRTQRQLRAGPLHSFRVGYPDRHEAMARAYLSGAYTMREIAEAFGVHYMTVSRAVHRIEAQDRVLEC